MNCCELWQTSTSKHSEHTATSIRKFIVTERLTLTLFTSSLLCWLQLDGRSELSHSWLSLFFMIYRNIKRKKKKKKNKERESCLIHIFYSQQRLDHKKLRQNTNLHQDNFMGGPCRNQKNWWKVRCQIWWYCWIFKNLYFWEWDIAHCYTVHVVPLFLLNLRNTSLWLN